MPRPPTDAECEILRKVAEDLYRKFRDAERQNRFHLGEAERSARASGFEAAVEASRAWFAAGCPQHPVLGIYGPDGGGGEVRIIEWETASASMTARRAPS